MEKYRKLEIVVGPVDNTFLLMKVNEKGEIEDARVIFSLFENVVPNNNEIDWLLNT